MRIHHAFVKKKVMGFFSWKTQDTNQSIANSFSGRNTFKVHMVDNKGNVYTEHNYEGYGVFGGKDFFVLLSEMNGIFLADKEDMREAGIDLAFSNKPYLSPNLVRNLDNWRYTEQAPEDCEYQGYFY